MISVQQLLARKGYDVWITTPDASVYEALLLLAEKNIGALPVVQDKKLVGIISERDYARKVILSGKTARETSVSEIMSTELITISLTTTVDEAMALVTENRIRHLPVMDGERIAGIVTIGDLVMSVIANQEMMINQLEDYITGKR